jgi:hypothetical protein
MAEAKRERVSGELLRKFAPKDGEAQLDESQKGPTREHQTNAQAFALSADFKDRRRRQTFPWSMYGGHEWTDDGDMETIAILFGERACIVRGYRFERLDRDLTQGKRATIREHTKSQVESMLAQEGDEPIIVSIETFPSFPELLASIKGEEEHETRHARRA